MKQFMEENFEYLFFTEKDDVFWGWVGGGGCGIHITGSSKRGIGMCFIENLVRKMGECFGGFCKVKINMKWRNMTLVWCAMG